MACANQLGKLFESLNHNEPNSMARFVGTIRLESIFEGELSNKFVDKKVKKLLVRRWLLQRIIEYRLNVAYLANVHRHQIPCYVKHLTTHIYDLTMSSLVMIDSFSKHATS